MNKRERFLDLKQKNGITLIALVISIIVMLILAGVSLNAVIGDNGIITQAQNAKMSFAVTKFSDYLQGIISEFIIKDPKYNIEDLYLSSGWLERKLETDSATGNVYYVYIINKSKITDEDMLANMEGGNGDPYMLQDVYGINPDFTIWYKNDKGELISSQIQVVAISDNTEVNFADEALSDAISNSVGIDKDNVTIGDLKNITTLKLNYNGLESNIRNLNDLYYLPSLSNLYIYNLTLDNIDGLKYCSKLSEVYINGCNLNNFDGLKYCALVRTLTIEGISGNTSLGINDLNVEIFFNSIKELSNITSLSIINSYGGLTNIDAVNSRTSKFKFKIKYYNIKYKK